MGVLSLDDFSDGRILQDVVSGAPVFLFAARPGLLWEYVNPTFYNFTGLPPGAAMAGGWLDTIHPDDLDTIRHACRTAGARALTCEARFRRRDGAWRWHLIQALPRHGADGSWLGWTGSCVDIDDRRAMEARQGRMLSELQHRIRNILALVRSVLTRTMETSDNLDHFASHLSGRISALARAQSAAARRADRVIRLDELLHDELTATGGHVEAQFRVCGPTVLLPDHVSTAIALALHELTTNSIKFGALSLLAGVIDVRWHLLPGDQPLQKRLVLSWQETGVPLVDLRPKRRGFGRELIEQGLPYELGATTELAFRPGGLSCRIELPLKDDSFAEAGS